MALQVQQVKINILIPFSLLFTNTGVIKKTLLLDENGQTMSSATWLRYDDDMKKFYWLFN